MSVKAQCPGCGCGGGEQKPLEKINIAEQHQKYAPANPEVCRRLTDEAEKSAPSYQMLCCANCGLEFADPMRSPNASWYALAYQTLALYPQARWEFQTCLNALGPSDEVFEFGCGSGAFLEHCHAKKIKARGVDFSPDAVDQCVQKGLDAFIFEIGSPLPATTGQSASQIMAFHVLEHLEQPRLLYEQALQVAASDAQLWIAVPSCLRPTRQRGITDFLDQPPHHMTRWSQTSLEQIGLKNGWRMIRFQTEPLSFRTALWWIVKSSRYYRVRREEGRLSNATIERCLRFANYPAAMIRRMTVDRKLTGFSMLACYVRS